MYYLKYISHLSFFGTIALLAASVVGCKSADESCWGCADIPSGAIPRQTGIYACQWQTAQTNLAAKDHLVIYENEWYMGGKELGPFGQRHIAQVAELLKSTQSKVVVEPHFDPARNAMDENLNQARLAAVAQHLAEYGVDNATDRVQLTYPKAEGLYGAEAVRIGANWLQAGRVGGGTNSGGQFGGIGSPMTTGGGTGVIGGGGVGGVGY